MSEIDWSKAPEGAEYFAPEHGGWSEGWYRLRNERWEFHLGGIDRWDAVATEDVNKKRPLIPCPTEWRGPEDGLPPVGTVALGKMPAWRKEEPCKVIAHLHGSCVVVRGIGDNPDSWSTLSWCDQFRPIKSDKERAVEAAMKVMPYPGSPSTRADLECAYDAGLLRLPEEQS